MTANVYVQAPGEAPPAGTLVELAVAQAACLRTDALCQPVPVPRELAALAPVSPATPVASPVGSPVATPAS